MPAYEDVLSEDEITAVLDYIKSLWPEEIRTIQQQQTMNVQP
jgi:mono/diheme cytochrome c family protein